MFRSAARARCTVRRTLPQRSRSLIGAWCFVDHYGPDRVTTSGGMDRSAASAHRTPDRQLALRRRDRSPRQRRLARDRPPGRTQPHDGGARHPALRGLVPGDDGARTARSCGSRCPTRVATPHRSSSVSCRRRSSSAARPCVCSWASCSAASSTARTFSTGRRRPARSAGGHVVDFRSIRHFEHGVLVDTGAATVNGTAVGWSELAYVAVGCRRPITD